MDSDVESTRKWRLVTRLLVLPRVTAIRAIDLLAPLPTGILFVLGRVAGIEDRVKDAPLVTCW